jgi:hypothetical protein
MEVIKMEVSVEEFEKLVSPYRTHSGPMYQLEDIPGKWGHTVSLDALFEQGGGGRITAFRFQELVESKVIQEVTIPIGQIFHYKRILEALLKNIPEILEIKKTEEVKK